MYCTDNRHDNASTKSHSILDTITYDGVNIDEIKSFLGNDFTGLGKFKNIVWFKDPCCGNTRSLHVGNILFRHSNGGYTTH